TGVQTCALPIFYVRPPGRHLPKGRLRRSRAMLSLPLAGVPQDFGALFDADSRAAISSGLCIQCRGAKLLCGKSRCPILVRWDSMMKTAPMIDRFELDGASAPGVFVGR